MHVLAPYVPVLDTLCLNLISASTSSLHYITHTRHICSQVKVMSSEDTEHKDLFKRNLSHGSLTALAGQVDAEAEHGVSEPAGSQPAHRSQRL